MPMPDSWTIIPVRTKKIVATTDEKVLRRLAGQQLFAALATRVLDGELIDR